MALWIEHGEKPTKYSCILEKRNYVDKNTARFERKKENIWFDPLRKASLPLENKTKSSQNATKLWL